MSKIRNNSNIKYIIIQHTGHLVSTTGSYINEEYNSIGNYGAPYDIIINTHGTIDIMPRWIRSPKNTIMEPNIGLSRLFKYTEHFYSDILPIYYRDNSIIIGVVGNFDIARPNSLMFTSLINVIERILYYIDLDLRTSLLYYSEIYNDSSPGVFFFDKNYIISYIRSHIRKTPLGREGTGITGGGGGGNTPITPVGSHRLLENGSYRLLENGSYRLLES